MARPLEFDRDMARDRALKLFWSRGYQGAGLTDLLGRMEIGRSSFYGAFGDKRRLFIECLDQFAARTISTLTPKTPGRPAMETLRGFFEQESLASSSEERGWGCLLVNSVVELADLDEGLRAHAGRRLMDVQSAFETLLAQAGFSSAQARDYAAFLMVVNQGLRVSSRQGLATSDQQKQISVTFDMLTTALNSALKEA